MLTYLLETSSLNEPRANIRAFVTDVRIADADPQNILDPRTDSGSFAHEKLPTWILFLLIYIFVNRHRSLK